MSLKTQVRSPGYDKIRAMRRQKHGLRSKTFWCRGDKCPYATTCDELKAGKAICGEPCEWLARERELLLLIAKLELGVCLDDLAEGDRRIAERYVDACCRLAHAQRALGLTDITVTRVIQTPAGPMRDIRITPEFWHARRASSQYCYAFLAFSALRRRVYEEFGRPKQTVREILEEAGLDRTTAS